MASIAPSRLAALVKTRCTVFQTSYNPTSIRTGAKYLRARLRGPSMMNYYPPPFSLASIIRQFPEMGLVDAAEQQRLQDVEDRKKRGKGAPKKAKSKGMPLRFHFASFFFLTFSPALFFLQPTAGVLRGSGRMFFAVRSRLCKRMMTTLRGSLTLKRGAVGAMISKCREFEEICAAWLGYLHLPTVTRYSCVHGYRLLILWTISIVRGSA